MLHSIGCAQPDAAKIANYWNSYLPGGKEVCCHGVVDTQSFYQTLPFDVRGWHCGGKGNNSYIGIEATEPECIVYKDGADFSVCNKEKAYEHIIKTYNNAVLLFADLCIQYDLDPLKNGVVISHSEGYKRGIASNHADVEHLWNEFGLTMDGFRLSVANKVSQKRGQHLESVKEIVDYLHTAGIVSNVGLWYEKLENDINSYWLARKTAQYIIERGGRNER